MAVINGTVGTDTLVGTSGADELYGVVGNDSLSGGDGNDLLDGGAGADVLNGGNGVDTASYLNSAAAVTVSLVTGTGLGGDAQGDSLSLIERVVGSSFGDTLSANASGAVLEGGVGNDVYIVNGYSVSTIEQAGGGNDEIRTTLTSMSLAANIENLTYTGTGSFTGYGNTGDNVITGGAGTDTLMGGAGADQFIGGAGIDTVSYSDSNYIAVTINTKTGINTGIAAGDTYNGIEIIQGGLGDDTFISGSAADTFDGLAGNDTVDYSTSSAAVSVSLVAGAVGAGGDAQGDKLSSIDKVIGTAFNDTLASNTSSSVLEGGAGNDVYVISGNGVSIIEQIGGGDDEVRTTMSSLSLAGNIERLTYTGTGNFTGYGNAGDNVITGGIGNDVLLGGAGADQFIGGDGTDTVSYADSLTGVTINTNTGVNTGIATGDTYNSIEVLKGSSYGDVFIGSNGADRFDGGDGFDMISFANESSGITLDLSVPVLTGVAAGDAYTSFEVFQGTSQADTFTGSTGAKENFIGGGGADILNGTGRGDGAWYLTSTDAVQINLQAGTASGGDAQGDVLNNIDNLIGSGLNDTLTGNALSNTLEGGGGNDLIYGGDGDDFIYGDTSSDVSALFLTPSTAEQADTLYGGSGNDYMVSSNHDAGTTLYGEMGNDRLTVYSGVADGGDGNDSLTGIGHGYELLGGVGADTLYLSASGDGFGGEGGDSYVVYSKTMVGIFDEGTTGIDTVTLKNIQSLSDVRVVKNDLGAYIFNAADLASGNLDSGVFLKDWYAGSNTIETFMTNNGDSFTVPV
ncbi:putative calcium-binding protein [Pseudomonas sp. GM102]|uniref:beta strand repeat-containing protein n=1 Tax=Pseudomonas sp. GM102 TaxID=1144321 RepID=UPI00026FCE60|nr:calcium-binding protein [Pseudomonas sp. GM102]EJM02197.1 putative calcium-binding protein [Pseudomonas sp. GM102]